MDVEKVSFNVETLYMQLEEQVPIESAIPLPQERTAGSVLSVTPQLQLREVPFSLTGQGNMVLPLGAAAFSTVTGRGRVLQARVELLFWGEQYAENRIGYTDDLLAGPGTQQSRGILIYAPDPEENLFTVGKRFGIPQNRLRELNGALVEPFSGTERILIIK